MTEAEQHIIVLEAQLKEARVKFHQERCARVWTTPARELDSSDLELLEDLIHEYRFGEYRFGDGEDD